MKTKIRRTISTYKMLTDGEKVLVGLSGGADSVALMLSLAELGYEVFACHINHQLRGEESDRDEAFCSDLCKRLNVKLFVEKIDVYTYCKENKLGIEEGARNLRYKAFEKYAEGSKIATAHTLSDCLETTLINLTRGTALKGLCGIPPVRDKIIRPLINCTRQDIEDYLFSKKQDYVTDSTNLSADYTRNKIRLEVIPRLLEINTSLYKNYARTISSISADNSYLDDAAFSILKNAECGENEYSCERLLNADSQIASRCIALILKNLEFECSNKKISEILEIIKCGGKINLSGDVYAISQEGKIIIKTIVKNEKKHLLEELIIDKKYFFYNKVICAKVFNADLLIKNENINNLLANSIMDCDKIQGKAVFRNRRQGDRIRFASKDCTTSIKKLFNEKIPLEKRDDIIFIADEEGVIFVEGFGISARVSVDSETKRLMKIDITEGHEQNE